MIRPAPGWNLSCGARSDRPCPQRTCSSWCSGSCSRGLLCGPPRIPRRRGVAASSRCYCGAPLITRPPPCHACSGTDPLPTSGGPADRRGRPSRPCRPGSGPPMGLRTGREPIAPGTSCSCGLTGQARQDRSRRRWPGWRRRCRTSRRPSAPGSRRAATRQPDGDAVQRRADIAGCFLLDQISLESWLAVRARSSQRRR